MEYPSLSRYNNDNNNNDEAPHRAAILKKIELYRKVFPQHVVVGWYRVRKHGDEGGGDQEEVALPTEEDLRLTQEEMGRYCNTTNNVVVGDDANGSGPIFVLMDATRTTIVDGGSKIKPSASTMSATMEMDEDEELPLTVYETLVSPSTGGNVAFVNADFDLETYEPERIAVEKVFRTRPTKTTVTSSTSSGAEGRDRDGIGVDSRKTGKKSKKDNNNNVGQKHPQQQRSTKSSAVRVPTELDEQFESLETSIRAMNLRISVLCEYLTRVEQGEVLFDEALLRTIDGLVRQLPLVLAALESGRLTGSTTNCVGGGRTPLLELENEYDNTMLLTYLATVAKTARAVHVYSEKFRTVCDTGKSDRRPLY